MVTVTGIATVGTTTYPLSAPLTLPAPAAPGACYFGGWDPASGYPGTSFTGLAKFGPALASGTYYLAHKAPWADSGAMAFTAMCAARGVVPYLNLEPQNTWGGGGNPVMADIAAGKDDAYYIAFAAGIKALGKPVLLTIAHEMNGTWYPWGRQAITPATWMAVWKHVVGVMRAVAGNLIRWVWCPNNNDVGSVKPYWPGDAYVDIAGFDGYLNQNSDSQTYGSFVKGTVTEIRSLTAKPVWNAETGVNPGANRLTRLIRFTADMHADGLTGFTWWNEDIFTLAGAEMTALTGAVTAWNATP